SFFIPFPRKNLAAFTKQGGFGAFLTILLQCTHCLLENRQSPLPHEYLFRGIVLGRLSYKALFGMGFIERNNECLPTALLAMSTAPFVGHEIVQRPQKEGAEFSPGLIYPTKMVFIDELREKLLGEVLRFVRTVTFPADVSVNRIPVT